MRNVIRTAALLFSLLLLAAPAKAEQYTGQAWTRTHNCNLMFSAGVPYWAACGMEASSSVYDWGGNRPWHTSGALSLEGDAYRLYYERAAGNSRAGNPSYEEFVPRGAYYEWFFYSSAAGTKTLVARIPAP